MNYGIICEYNPFHNGHKYQIEQTGNKNDNIICVMSGQYVQRSSPAIFDKWTRASWAVKNGANLVIELPTVFSASSAEYFAKAGITLLDSLGICDYISFGCENDDIKRFEQIAEIFASNDYVFKLKEFLDKGNSFAMARQKTIETFFGKDASILSKPNNILGIEYIKALKSCNSNIKPIGIKRIYASHDTQETENNFTSASNIREKIYKNDMNFELIPENIRKDMKIKIDSSAYCKTEEFYKACYRQLLNTSEEELSKNPYIKEGLEYKFLKELNYSKDYNSLLENVKSKRYAHSRLRRILFSNYLKITKYDINSSPCYIRILAFDNKGRELIKSAKEKAVLPVITKPAHIKNYSEEVITAFEKENRFTNLSFSFYEKSFENNMDYKTSPVFVK